jgi:hypothetical protein
VVDPDAFRRSVVLVRNDVGLSPIAILHFVPKTQAAPKIAHEQTSLLQDATKFGESKLRIAVAEHLPDAHDSPECFPGERQGFNTCAKRIPTATQWCLEEVYRHLFPARLVNSVNSRTSVQKPGGLCKPLR